MFLWTELPENKMIHITCYSMSITDFTFSENVTSVCEIHGLPECVLCKCRTTAISYASDSLTVGFVKHVLCGHFHLVPLIILIWNIRFLVIKI